LILSGCGRKDRDEAVTTSPVQPVPTPQPPQQNCSAEFIEYQLPDGSLGFVLQGHWVRCEGRFGESRPWCRWWGM
jgi:hypothetical protein